MHPTSKHKSFIKTSTRGNIAYSALWPLDGLCKRMYNFMVGTRLLALNFALTFYNISIVTSAEQAESPVVLHVFN